MKELNKSDENIRNYDFSSVVIMSEKEHRELNNVSWAKTSVFWLAILIVSCVLTVVHQVSDELEIRTFLPFVAWILLLYIITFFITRKKIKNAYKRLTFSQGSDSITYKTYFGEKITVETDKHAPVEYDYNMITSIKETNRFYLLGFKYNLYLIVWKDIKSETVSADFLEYIFGKCPNIKKKKVQKVMNKERNSVVLLCCFAALFLLNLIMFFI